MVKQQGEKLHETTKDLHFAQIPRFGFLRLKQVLQYIPISPSQWWAGVKEGRFPPSIKLSARTTVWSAEDIYNLVEQLRAAQAA